MNFLKEYMKLIVRESANAGAGISGFETPITVPTPTKKIGKKNKRIAVLSNDVPNKIM